MKKTKKSGIVEYLIDWEYNEKSGNLYPFMPVDGFESEKRGTVYTHMHTTRIHTETGDKWIIRARLRTNKKPTDAEIKKVQYWTALYADGERKIVVDAGKRGAVSGTIYQIHYEFRC